MGRGSVGRCWVAKPAAGSAAVLMQRHCLDGQCLHGQLAERGASSAKALP